MECTLGVSGTSGCGDGTAGGHINAVEVRFWKEASESFGVAGGSVKTFSGF